MTMVKHGRGKLERGYHINTNKHGEKTVVYDGDPDPEATPTSNASKKEDVNDKEQ